MTLAVLVSMVVTVGLNRSATPEPNWMAEPAASELYVNFKCGSKGPEPEGARARIRLPVLGLMLGECPPVPGTTGVAWALRSSTVFWPAATPGGDDAGPDPAQHAQPQGEEARNYPACQGSLELVLGYWTPA